MSVAFCLVIAAAALLSLWVFLARTQSRIGMAGSSCVKNPVARAATLYRYKIMEDRPLTEYALANADAVLARKRDQIRARLRESTCYTYKGVAYAVIDVVKRAGRSDGNEDKWDVTYTRRQPGQSDGVVFSRDLEDFDRKFSRVPREIFSTERRR